MKRPLRLAPWLLFGSLCCSRPWGVGALVSPTNQPATLGQDQQECGFLLLPERFQLWPATSSWFASRSVSWESDDRATFATCHQGIYPWIPQAVHCFVDSKLLFKSEVFADTEKLPGEVNVTSSAGFDTVVLRDCKHVVQYILKVSRASPGIYEIYNRLGQLVAQTLQDGGLIHKDVMRISDEEAMPVAVAQSPALEPLVSVSGSSGTPTPVNSRQEDDGTLRPWQIKFFDAYTSHSSLIIAQNRWVLAAMVQDRALRDVGQAPSITRFLIPFLAVLVVSALVFLGSALIGMLFPPLQKPGKYLPKA